MRLADDNMSGNFTTGVDLAHLRIAAMLHDIGKVVLPDRILQKPDSLNRLEYEEVKRHPEEGADLINRVEGMGPIAECRGALEKRLTDEALRLAGQAKLLATVAFSSLVLNGITMVAALLLFYRRRVVNPLVHLNLTLRDLVARKAGA